MTFTSIPVRTNDQTPDASWFNALRTAGTELQGSNALSVDNFALDESETVTAQSLPMNFGETTALVARVLYYVRQDDVSSFTYNIGEFVISRSTTVSTDFELVSDEISISGATNRNLITLSVTTSGVIQYISNNSTAVDDLRFTAVTIGTL